VIERKRAEEALKRSEKAALRLAQEAGVLAQIGRIISSSLDIEEVYERFAEEVRKLVPFDLILVNLVNQQEGVMTTAYTAGMEVAGRRKGVVVPITGSVTEQMIRTGAPILFQPESIEEVQNRFSSLVLSFQAGLRSRLSVPLIARGEVVGSLTLWSKQVKVYGKRDIRMAQSVASQIAGAIANAQLFQERKRAEEALKRSEKAALRLAQEAGVLAQIGRIISSSLDIEEVYERFAEEVRKLIPFDRILLNLVNPQEGTTTAAYTTGMEVAGRRKGAVFPLVGSITEQMIRTGAPILFHPRSIEDVHEQFPALVLHFQAGLRSRLSVPLIARGEVIGGLILWSKQVQVYGEQDIRMAQSVAGQIAGAIASAQLFQERKHAAEALKESEERYRGIFENAIEGIFQSTPEGRFVSVNPSLARIYGWESPLEMVREVATVWSLYVDRAESVRHGKLLDEHGVVRGLEVEHRRKDGSKFWVSLDIREVKDSNGKMVHYEGLVQDSTERKKLEEQLRQAQKMEAVGTLAGGIAHDFNNILAAIIGFTEMVIDDVSDNAPVQQKMERVLKAGFRGRDLVRQILTFSRRSDEEKKALQMSPLIQETFKLLRASTPTTIEMKLDLGAHRDLANADPSQIQQIIMNLCTNASHAMREKGGTLEVVLRAITIDTGELLPEPDMAPGEYLVLSVSDTGEGMDDSVMKRIFDPFFTTKEKGQGTGLGLAVVYGIVKSHKGGIRVSSRPGQGSVFSVYLPATSTREEVESETVSWDTLPTGTERILFVDDEEPLVELGRGVLRRLGYTVVAKRSGREALETFREDGAFDLVITDQTMPEMTGVMLAAELLKLRPDLPVILCTGYSESVSRETAQEVGIRGFLMKPLSKRDLAGAVRRALEGNK
jgi:PAS domain S-box-containing protein